MTQVQTDDKEQYIPHMVEGIVRSNKDPKNLGRVLVSLPILTVDGTMPIWCYPFGGVGNGKQRGWFDVPDVGSAVMIFFAYGQLDRPYYTAGPWSKPAGNTEVPTEVQGQENKKPEKRAYETDKWRMLFDDTGAGEFHVERKGGDGFLKFLDDGTVVLDGAVAIELGEGATEAVIKGDLFKTLYNAHTHPTGVGPSGVPVVLLSTELSTIVTTLCIIWPPLLFLIYLLARDLWHS